MSAKPPRRPGGKSPRSGRNPGRNFGDPKSGGPRGNEPGRQTRQGAASRGPRQDSPNRASRQDSQTHASRRERPATGDSRPRGGEGWIYGHHAVQAALANPKRRCERLVVTTEAAEILANAGVGEVIRPEIRAAHEIAALLPEGAVHQGFALKARPLPERNIEEILAPLAEGQPALVVVLDQVTDPRNVGAILRSAAAFGALTVILPERHGADVTAALAKAASGALETVALVRVTNVSRTLEALKAGGFWCVGLDAQAKQALAEVDLSGRVALVLGSEGAGMRRLVSDTCDLHARLPIGGDMESLNVSAAAAIAMYEVARRRV